MSGMEHEFEPVRGLPEALPAGEHIVWQGTPRWQRLAVDALHVRKVAAYFVLLGAWRVADLLAGGAGAAAALAAAAWTVALAGLAIGLLLLMAWLMARTTVYTLTNRRIVMRIGVVLHIAFNLPLARIASATLRRHRDGSGDIMIELAGPDRIAYLHLWPHARPWHLRQPQPMLRALPEVDRIARTVADALAASAGQPRPALAEASGAERPVPAASPVAVA